MAKVTLLSFAVTTLALLTFLSSPAAADDYSCDFSAHPEYFTDATFVTCSVPMDKAQRIEVTCPNEVNGIQYHFYPEDPTKNVYVYNKSGGGNNVSNFAIKEMPLKKIFGRVNDVPLVTFKDETKRTLVITYPEDGYLVRHVPYSVLYFCKDELRSISTVSFLSEVRDLLNVRRDTFAHGRLLQVDAQKKSDSVGLMSIFKLDTEELPLVTHGCGNAPTSLFTNPQLISGIFPLQSCSVNVVATPNVGFYCTGKIEPRACFDELVTLNDSTFRITNSREKAHKRGNFYWANFNGNFLRRVFSGDCVCKDEYDHIVSIIEVKRPEVTICNVFELLPQVGGVEALDGDLCSATMYPSDTFKIKFPRLNSTFDPVTKTFKSIRGKGARILSALGIDNVEAAIYQRLNPLEPMRFVRRELGDLFPRGELKVTLDLEDSSVTLNYKRQPQGMKESYEFTYLWRHETVGYKDKVEGNVTISVTLMPTMGGLRS